MSARTLVLLSMVAGCGSGGKSPTVTLTAPSYLRGVATISVAAKKGDAALARATLQAGTASATCTATAAGFDCALDTSGLADGKLTLAATVFDQAGKSASAMAETTVDNTAPLIAIAAPADGAVVGGTVSIAATANDATSGVAQVEFAFGGSSLGVVATPDGDGSFRLAWDASMLMEQGMLTATASDLAGNTASTAIQIDVDNSSRATVTGVGSPSADRTYVSGETIDVAVSFSRPVVVTGTPTLTLETGATDRDAGYLSGSGTSTLTFRYTVAAGDSSPDLDYLSSTALSGAIRDEKGRDAILALPAPGAAGSLGATKALVLDAILPSVTQLGSPLADGAYKAGQTIDVTVTFSKPVIVDSGAPTLTLETGAVDRAAIYQSGSGTATLTFRYLVQAGDNTPDLDATGTSSLALAGAPPLHDAIGNPASLTLPAPGAPGSLGAAKAIVVDSTAPTVVSVSSTTPNGAYGTGAVIDVRVTFSEPVVVTGAPTLGLDSGGTASYLSTSGDTVIFTYTVAAGHESVRLDANGINLNGGTIRDPAGNAAGNINNPPGGLLYDNKNIIVDAVGPNVDFVTTTKANGIYGPTTMITIVLNFDEYAFVSGVPTLTLDSGGVATYSGGSGGYAISFNYTVQAGQYSPDLDYASTSALSLNGGTIVDNLGNAATLTLPPPGPGNNDSLAGYANLFIDDDPLGVHPAFPVAPNWNDYYKTADPTLACGDNDNGRDACRHGGELRKVVTTETSCGGLSMTDALGAFDWRCAVVSSKATFTGTLKSTRGLRHLVDAAAWKNNAVTLAGGAGGSSVSRRWWANLVAPAPAGVALVYLDQPSQIYTVAANRTGFPRIWIARKVALVVFDGATLTFPDTFDTSTTRYAWIEGRFDIGAVCNGVFDIYQTSVSRMHQVTTLGCCGTAVSIRNSSPGNRLTQIRSTIPPGCQMALDVDASSPGTTIAGYAGNGGNSGIVRLMGDDNLLTDFTLANSGLVGLVIRGDRNTVANGRIFNNGQYGLELISAHNTVVSQVFVTNNNRGLTSTDGYPGGQNILSGLTVTDHGNLGLYLQNESQYILFGTAFANNGSNLYFNNSNGTVAQLAAAHFYGIDLSLNSDNFKFTGNLVVPLPGAGVCYDNGSVNLKNDCSNDGISDANLIRVAGFADNFFGKAPSDSSNPDGGATGFAGYSATLDWLDFQNLYRAWGTDGAAFPAIDNINRCSTGGTCRIWDWSLRSTATVIRNTTLTPSPSPSPNPAFVDSGACPTDGTQFLESSSYSYDGNYRAGLNGFDVAAGGACVATKTCKQRFLKAALETIGDGLGDDDGLCESNEACLYMPNFGAYQGSGALGKCTFSDGAISGVQLSGYLTNGE